MHGSPTLQFKQVHKSYLQGGQRLDILRGVDFLAFPGEVVALVGPSGSGKSTLLHIAGLLEQPTKGRVLLGGQDTGGLSDAERSQLRRQEVGFVYQSYGLLSDFSALENVILPQRMAGLGWPEAAERARQLLGMVGLSDRLQHRPSELSGGEQQRVAVARSVANAPSLLLADEPTGNLDLGNAGRVVSIFLEIVRQAGLTVLLATHDNELAHLADRRILLREGGACGA